jgi:hypothetical protein
MFKFKGTLDVNYKGMKTFVDEYDDPMTMLHQLLGYAVRENGEKAVRDLVESIAGCHPDAVEVGLTRDAFIAHLLAVINDEAETWWLISSDESKEGRLAAAESEYDKFVTDEFVAQTTRDGLAERQARELENSIQAQRYADSDEQLMIPVKVPITRGKSKQQGITGTMDVSLKSVKVQLNNQGDNN